MPKDKQIQSLGKSIAMSRLSINGSNDKKVKELKLGDEVNITITGAKVRRLNAPDRFDISEGGMKKDDVIANLEFSDEKIKIK